MRALVRGVWLAAFPVTGLAIAELALAFHARYVSGLHPERAMMGGTALGMVLTTPALVLASAIGAVGVALFVRAIRRGRLRPWSPAGVVMAAATVALAVVLAPFWAICVRVLVETYLPRRG